MKFKYQAKKGLDDVIEGTIEAENKEDALNKVFLKGLFPITVDIEQKEPAAKKASRPEGISRKFKFKFFKKAGPRQVFIFIQKLTILIRAKVELLSALKIIYDQSEHPHFKKIILAMYNYIKEGKTFSQALEKFPALFSPLFIGTIRAGEAGGSLEVALAEISKFLSREENLKRKVAVALAYPSILILVGVASILVLMNFVIPRLQPVFYSLGRDLPFLTKVILGISAFSHKNLAVVLAIIIVLPLAAYFQRGNPFVKLWVRKLKGKTPLVKRVIQEQELAHFSRSLGLLLKSGVPALKTLEIAIPTVENEKLRRELEGICRKVAQGKSLSRSIETISSLPPFFAKMIAVGEESGRLAEVLEEISLSYTQQVEDNIALISSLLEPMLILALGIIIGAVVLSILIPIFQITQMVG